MKQVHKLVIGFISLFIMLACLTALMYLAIDYSFPPKKITKEELEQIIDEPIRQSKKTPMITEYKKSEEKERGKQRMQNLHDKLGAFQ